MRKSVDRAKMLSSPNKKLIKRKRKALKQDSSFDTSDQKGRVKVQVSNILQNNPSRCLTFEADRQSTLVELKQLIYAQLHNSNIQLDKIVGFQSKEHNFAFDYRLYMGIGQLDQNLKIQCLHYEDKKGLEKYSVCCCLAIGGFSKVFLVRSRQNGGFYAAKFIDKSKKDLLNMTLLRNEKQISLELESPFLVKTHEFIQTEEFYVFIMDYCPGGELFYLLKQIKFMNQEEARVCFIQILLGIEHMHKLGYMYRDLKPENILLDAYGYIKIADFGLSKKCSEKSYSFCGSVEYMAPEVIRGKGHQQHVDYYCMGALLYQILVGHPPFYDLNSTQDESKARILFEEISFPDRLELSQSVKDLIRRLTAKNQKQRLGYYGGCKEIMTHPWVGRVNRRVYEQRQFKSPFPVSLNRLNFDKDEIGASERRFEQRIISEIQRSKSKVLQKHQKNMRSEQKLKSRSLVSKKKFSIKSPYKKDNFMSANRTQISKPRSPYTNVLKNSMSYKVVKTESSEQGLGGFKRLHNESLLGQYLRESKQNKLLGQASKLKKKCKYLVCNTIPDSQPEENPAQTCKNWLRLKNSISGLHQRQKA